DCDTSHGSVVEYKGQWYAFYHNKSISGQGTLKAVCVDQLNFNEDCTIQQVVQTSSGVPCVGPRPAANPGQVRYEAESATFGNGAMVENEENASGGKSVHNLHLADSWLQFENVNGGTSGGRATIEIVHAAKSNAKLRL